MVTGERQARRIRVVYLKTILRQDMTFFDIETTTGDVIERMTGDTLLIHDAIGEKVGKFIQLMSAFFGCYVIAFTKSWLLSSLMLSCIPPLVIGGIIMSKYISKVSYGGQAANAEAANVVEQTVGAIRTVVSFTGEKAAIHKYNKLLRTTYFSTIQQAFASGIGFGFAMAILYSYYGLAILYGSKLIVEKGYNGGEIVNVIISFTIGGMSLGQASQCLNSFAAGKAASYKMFKLIKRKPWIDSTFETNGIVIKDIKGDIKLKDIYFSYPTRPNVQIFTGFSLHVPNGTSAALVGHSGSGKSTVINLLERFYDPNAGEVLIDDINLKELQLKWLREKIIGLVSQEPILFATTIKENITYGKENATDEEIKEAIELANAAKFIDMLPKGIQTMVCGGHGGIQLSGGQKQRIAIARAILKNPKILLLDEATSALDVESEKIVQDALERIMLNRTVIMIAHRFTTIRNAKTIYVVHQGKIVEQGTHTELSMNRNGTYSQLIRSLQEDAKQTEDHIPPLEPDASTMNRFYRATSTVIHLEDKIESNFENNIKTTIDQQADGKPVHHKKVSLVKQLAYMNKPELPILVLGSIAAVIQGAIPPTFGLLLSNIIKIFYEPPNELRRDSKLCSFMFIGLGCIGLIFVPLQHLFIGVAGGKLIERIRSMCFEKVVHQEISWFDDVVNSSGAIETWLSTDALRVRSLVGDALALGVQNTSTIIIALIIAFMANWQLALIVLALLPLLGSEGYAQMKFVQGFSTDSKVKYEEANQVAYDAVGGIRTVASFCSEQKVMNLYKDKCKDPWKQEVRQGLISGVGLGSANFALYSAGAFCCYVGGHLVKDGKANFEQVFRVFLALIVSAIEISQTNAMAPDSNKARDSAGSIFKILNSKPKIDSSSDVGMTLANVRGDIVFLNINFKYPTRPDVQILKDFCLTISAGKTIALVGESGSGKSTVINLLQRFYDPDSGHILLDGMEISKLKINWLRQQMGLVSQEPILFNETIKANIVYGKQGRITSEDEIITATKASNAHNFISGLPQGYDTRVGERGTQLSGGQKQRIAIARAILKDPKILLLDEATSALDAESERTVQDTFQRVMINRTTIVVAHRLSTIKGADIIVVVKNGVIIEQGRHEVLMKIKNGAYASLVALHMTANVAVASFPRTAMFALSDSEEDYRGNSQTDQMRDFYVVRRNTMNSNDDFNKSDCNDKSTESSIEVEAESLIKELVDQVSTTTNHSAVTNINDDDDDGDKCNMFAEISYDMKFKILSCLPPKSLFKFKCVSKEICRLIEDFVLEHSQRLASNTIPFTGFFIRERDNYGTGYQPSFISTNTKEGNLPDSSLSFLKDDNLKDTDTGVKLMDSCNGLLLCEIKNNSRFKSSYINEKLYVCNPLTMQKVFVPYPRNYRSRILFKHFALMVQSTSTGYLSYKVVYIHDITTNWKDKQYSKLWIFSSETGEWETFPYRLPAICADIIAKRSKIFIKDNHCHSGDFSVSSLCFGDNNKIEWKIENSQQFSTLAEDIQKYYFYIAFPGKELPHKDDLWGDCLDLQIVAYNPSLKTMYVLMDGALLSYELVERRFELVWGTIDDGLFR
ncbi:ABC transporter [Macleaya cordata]|uniref:ABC transporter n=1 Tax=Macleaya cordata TaxID=56857 RepID=A0A200R300_MACCD|nr:ABC transporter [Macleaya cordata]